MVTAGAAQGGGARAVARCDALGAPPFTDGEAMLYRPYLGPGHRAALETLAGWMTEAGLRPRLDPAANLIGRYDGYASDAPALIIGSHIDSVRDAGRYDGPLGVMLGVECVAALSAAGRRTRFPIEVVAFGDEEGSRFATPMLCSRALAGVLDPGALDISDREGVTLAEALAPLGLDVWHFAEAAQPNGSVLAFLEAHIEQGPVLEAEGLALGVVTGIAAQTRFAVTMQGLAGHAGTSAMPLRRDALAGAAEAVLAVEAIAREQAAPVVATVGQLTVAPGAVNVVPGRVQFSIDVRSAQEADRDTAADLILKAVKAIADRRGLSVTIDRVYDAPASPCDPALTDHLAKAVESLGLPARRMASGAGHDAMMMAKLCPAAMLFIRCAGGISHNPAERVEPADADQALAAMLAFIDRLEASW